MLKIQDFVEFLKQRLEATDGVIYKCLSDTVYSPVEYAGAWEAVAV